MIRLSLIHTFYFSLQHTLSLFSLSSLAVAWKRLLTVSSARYLLATASQLTQLSTINCDLLISTLKANKTETTA
jgi:hypothetical protein